MMRSTCSLVCALLFCAVPSWSQTAPAGLPEKVFQEVREPEMLPKAHYVLARTWQAEGEGVGHGIGRAVDDPEADGGKAWEAKTGDAAAGMLVFGPYLELEPGDYCALFRIKLLAGADDEDTIGDVDACVSYGQNILAGRAIDSGEVTTGRYTRVPLAFHYPGGKLECRLNWGGYASLRLDSITLFKLEGASLKNYGRVPAATPSGKPNNLVPPTEPRPFPDIFPRSQPPAPELLVCDLQKEAPDRRLMLATLEGIVNRTRPQLYYIYAPQDRQWLDWMLKRKWIKSTLAVKSNDELLQRFRDRIKGMVITDPRLPASINVATMIASVDDGIAVSPHLAKKLALPVLDDLHGKWQTSVAAYRWAFDNLWPRLNHHVIACSWPGHLALRDYLVENKVFIFWISGPLDGARKYASPDAEVRLMEELLAKMPVNIPVMSYPWAGKDVGIGEGPGVSLFAEFGKYLVGSIDCANLSVHSGIPVPELRQRSAPPAPKFDDSKVYLSWVISDGDNLPVLMTHNFPQFWKDPTRGSLPLGWTLSPSASMLIPDIVDYYFSSATPDDEFLGAVSGVGYTYPDLYGKRYRDPYRQQVFDGFLDQTATYMRRSDERDLWIMNATRPEVISRFAEKIPFLDALFPDYGKSVSNYADATFPTARNVPVFHAATSWREDSTREERIKRLVDDIHAMTPPSRPAFLHAFVLNWFADLPMFKEVMNRLGPGYVAVRPDHLAALYREELSREKVLARFPSSIAAIEGREIVLDGKLRNVSSVDQNAQIRLISGLDGATLDPGEVKLTPAQEATIRLRGMPTGNQVKLELTGAFGSRTEQIDIHRIPTDELAQPFPAVGLLASAPYLEAESLPHRSGKAEHDADASGGIAWVARKGETEPNFIVYGPYAPLEEGKYLVLFRLKRLDEGTGPVALLDTCVGGGTPQTGKLEISASDLPLNKWRWFPIVIQHPGGAIETRIQWSGNASLAVDAIALWKIVSGG